MRDIDLLVLGLVAGFGLYRVLAGIMDFYVWARRRWEQHQHWKRIERASTARLASALAEVRRQPVQLLVPSDSDYEGILGARKPWQMISVASFREPFDINHNPDDENVLLEAMMASTVRIPAVTAPLPPHAGDPTQKGYGMSWREKLVEFCGEKDIPVPHYLPRNRQEATDCICASYGIEARSDFLAMWPEVIFSTPVILPSTGKCDVLTSKQDDLIASKETVAA